MRKEIKLIKKHIALQNKNVASNVLFCEFIRGAGFLTQKPSLSDAGSSEH